MAGESVLVGEFSHETNTFVKSRTGRAAFQERREYFDEEVSEKLHGTNTEVGGALAAASDSQIEVHTPVAAAAMPGGLVTADAYDFYTDRIVTAIEQCGSDLDGVFLALHGAMVPDGMTDGEGNLIANVRNQVGEDVPIVVTLDLHGNVSDEMVAAADALVAFESYPHVDMGDTGRVGMELLVRAIRDDFTPKMHVERPPMLAYYPKQNTRDGPMAAVMEKARALEEREHVVKVNLLPGFYHADIPSAGFSIPVVADTSAVARAVARELAETIWQKRRDFIAEYPGPAEAVEEAKQLVRTRDRDDGPVVMADLGDNPGGGGAGDGTTILRELLAQEVENAGFAIMHDPSAVAQCVEAGVGERVSLTLGGKTDELHGPPITDVDGYVKAITDGEFVNTGPMETGAEAHLGRAVRLECGADDGVSVLLTETRMQPYDAEIWRHMTIQPERLAVLVVKSLNHYRADYEPMASAVLPVDSPGLSAIDPSKFTFERLKRPKFPLDNLSDDAYPEWR
ncbi:Microcystin LR degradation protein MlrC-like protein (plasmid) [Natrialba magadii ATCC 43099]|uniref:Microcystin LR degradation protein MlrC-like protein n=1 Tax=Natrialba magadii (strain ATCC 43099 / DSM 3394 / CCM 3739 / CIP 104546 / IAM 13178 / JCM 8861 / NBRC 102185 / NCIMB 2190 / MS3) TaxID=547559 RepID=D3T156_NATMM|nr:M81 family metallopeptidase [Natrialba magadii]ADD07315.1 Microcystin LR degradation protein MlrC-like protein [Natrialba magadii ATCC 43099]ELY32697.1 microcystin LR degradation protein MlrC-like protein [Natrialba magadii ATCC 43099]